MCMHAVFPSMQVLPKKSSGSPSEDKVKTTWDKTKRLRPQDKFFRQGFHSGNVPDSSFFPRMRTKGFPLMSGKSASLRRP